MWSHIEGQLTVKESTVCPGDFKLIDCNGDFVASIQDASCGQYTEATAMRLAACWNALEGISDPSAVGELVEAVQSLFDADHYDHFASRMSDSEMSAIDKMKAALSRLKG